MLIRVYSNLYKFMLYVFVCVCFNLLFAFFHFPGICMQFTYPTGNDPAWLDSVPNLRSPPESWKSFYTENLQCTLPTHCDSVKTKQYIYIIHRKYDRLYRSICRWGNINNHRLLNNNGYGDFQRETSWFYNFCCMCLTAICQTFFGWKLFKLRIKLRFQWYTWCI